MRLNILIVDDNAAKTADIVDVLVNELGADNVVVQSVSCTSKAGKLLKGSYFDLLILDIAVPRLDGENPDRMGGIKFFDEVANRTDYHVPGHVVGITAYDEVLAEASMRLGSDLWSLIFYENTNEEWKSQLRRHVRYLIKAKTSAKKSDAFSCDLVVVTALATPELSAIRRLGWDWHQLEKPGDATVYFQGTFQRKDGTKGTAVVAHASGMGMPASASLVTKMGLQFKPKVIAMTGICAGSKGHVNLGDVVVANPAWDYGSGKVIGTNDGNTFQPAPYPLALVTSVRGIVERLQSDANALKSIKDSFDGTAPSTELRLHVGPFASGAAVIAAKDVLEDIRQQHRKLLAIDMEAYGVIGAAWELPSPQPSVIVLKGVSDFATEEKEDSLQLYAAHMSARVLAALCTDYGLC